MSIVVQPWITAADLRTDLAKEDAALRTAAIAWASEALRRRTRLQWGVADYDIQFNVPCSCGISWVDGVCVCAPRQLIHISPRQPIIEVASVTNVATSVAIPPERYGIVNEHWIGLVDSTNLEWATGWCNRLRVLFSAGAVPDAEGKEACAELAGEFLKLKANDQSCRLRSNQTGVIKRGRNGRRDVALFGIPLVDNFILSVNVGSASGSLDASAVDVFTLG